ncbi:ankyrin repeat domain-containing protein [Flavobacterium sp. '19STA2R22 D10 B1']|uniref:ankyrin repeat domain-containing protein n=1 Tax=Flavobacterium aerium TaxID=3037261 RepID=UPI00278BD0F0|nr:ankyrin repeat domain-containing protein [Flavobacterium sp. '19STA2R22 D10 B1']
MNEKSHINQEVIPKIPTTITIKELGNTANTLLHLACEWQLEEVVRHLLSKKIGINTLNDKGESPLQIASRNGNYVIVKMLNDVACTL